MSTCSLRRSAAAAALVTSLALLAGCSESPPAGYAPASWFECPDLGGVYRVESEFDLALSGTALRMPDGVSEVYLVIEQQGERGARVTLRRPVANVMREAEILRSRSPGAYEKWRQQVRMLQGDEQPPFGVPYGDGLAASLGPFVQASTTLTLPECESGWYELWPLQTLPAMDGAPPREVALALSANDGGLLVRVKQGTRNDTGFQFFGQSVGYYSYGDGQYHRLARVPMTAADFHLDPPALPDAGEARMAGRTSVLVDRGAALREFDRGLRVRLPPGVRLSILRELQFDPAAVAGPPGRMGVELSAYLAPGTSRDALDTALASDPRVVAVEVRRDEPVSGARRYVLLRVSYDIASRDTGASQPE